MSQLNPVPTVKDVLTATAVGNGWHDFAVNGGTLRVPTYVLRRVLESAHDSSMPNWMGLIDESDF